MKYIVVLGDGMADEPIESIGGKTPIEVAYTPNMDRMAQMGVMGMVRTVPSDMNPASDVANLSVMGYHPRKYYSGRSPLEAVSIGINLKDDDISFRCNVVTLSEQEPNYEDKTIIDHSCDEITTEEAKVLMDVIEENFGDTIKKFYTGRSYRHALIWNKGSEDVNLTPPHDILGQTIGQYKPSGLHADEIWDMMRKSYDLLNNHPINQARRAKGLNPANSIWIWGQGHKPALTPFEALHGLKGCVISAVDLILGIGICAGLKPIEVNGATGNLNTNYKGKAQAALDALLKDGMDFAYIHVEAPDECGHRAELENKILSIQNIDEQIVGYISKQMQLYSEEWAMMVLPDHPTPIRIRTHSLTPVPFVIYRNNVLKDYPQRHYSEKEATETGLFFEQGHTLMKFFLQSNH